MATIASAQQLAVANLYTALFNRAPDAAGLAFWVQALSNGASLATVTQSLMTTAEARAIYPAAQTAEQFVASFYQSVLGRAPDAAGLAFWTAALNADGGASSDAAKAMLVSQIVGIASAPLTSKPADLTDAQYAQTIADRAVFANKVTVGIYYAVELGGTNVDVAKQALASVGSSPASVDAAKLIVSGTSPSVPVVVAPAPSLLATVDTDTLSGTSGSDTFTATNLTLSALDSIDGGAGTDTLNYLDASTINAAFPAARVQNVEIINVRNVNTAGLAAEVFSVDMNSDNGLSAGQTLTVAGLTVTGTGYASDNDIAVAFRAGLTVGNVRVSGTLDPGYTLGGSDNTVLFISRVLGNVPDLVVSGSNASDPNVTVLQGTNGTPDTLVASNFIGATNFNLDRSTKAVLFAGLSAGQAIGDIGDNAMVNGSLTGTYAAGVAAAILNVSGGTKGGNVTINSASGNTLASATVTSKGLANTVNDLGLASTLTSLAFDASTNLTLGSVNAAGLRTITVSGTASAVSLGYLSSTVLESVDASGLTAGNVSVLLGANPATTFTGSAGNDTVSITGGTAITGTVDGGAGTDTLLVFAGGALTLATVARLISFEVVRVSNTIATQNFDASVIGGLRLQVGQSAGFVNLNNLAADAAFSIVGDATNLTLRLADTSGSADSANVTIGNGVASDGPLTNGVYAALKMIGIETVYLHSAGIAGGTAVNTFFNFFNDNLTLSKLVVDGSQPILLSLGTISRAFSVDASAATGAVTVDGGAASQAFDVSGGTASDRISGGRAGGLIVGGTGGDAISLYPSSGVDTLAYRTAADSRQDFVSAAGTAAGTQDAISGFVTGTDKIDVKALALDLGIRSFVTKTFATSALLLVGEAAADFYLDGGTTRGAVAAKIGSDTYLVVDANGDHLFSAATDLVVKLAGVTALAQGDVVYA